MKKMYVCIAMLVTLHIDAVILDAQMVRSSIPPVVFARETTIQEHQKTIEQALKQNALVRSIAKGAIGAGVVAACYMVYKNVACMTGDQLQLLQQQARVSADAAQKIMQVFPDLFKDYDMSKLAQTTHGWSKIMYEVAAAFVSNIILGIAWKKVDSEIFFDQTVEWFVHKRTKLASWYDTFPVVQKDMKYIQDQRIIMNDMQSDRYVMALARMHNTMVFELEKVIAYLRYKAEVINPIINDATNDALAGSYVFERINEQAQAFHDMITTYQQQSAYEDRVAIIVAMFQKLEQFSIELNSTLGRFKLCEQQAA